MLEYIDKYLNTHTQLENTRELDLDTLKDEYYSNRAKGFRDPFFTDRRKGIWDTESHGKKAARLELVVSIEARRGSDDLADRQAVFILDHCLPKYLYQALQVWQILPATEQELRNLGAKFGWCDVFNRYMTEAQDAGLVDAIVAAELEQSGIA